LGWCISGNISGEHPPLEIEGKVIFNGEKGGKSARRTDSVSKVAKGTLIASCERRCTPENQRGWKEDLARGAIFHG